MLALNASLATADVLNMPAGLTSLQFVPVGNPGNVGELSGQGADGQGADRICGAVNYSYQMGKFEITAGQYTAFLNAVATTDTYKLYILKMGYSTTTNIQRNGSSGTYTYSVASGWANRPVNWVCWDSAARFCNWLTNGQPTGNQNLSSTEDGSYFLDELSSRTTNITRKNNALYVIPTEDEWYKAAYYDPNKSGGAGYWDYSTKSNTLPNQRLYTPDRGNNANYLSDTLIYTIGSPYYRTEVGAFSNSVSPYGTFDQGGNILEWTEDLWGHPSFHVLRGGSYAQPSNCLSASFRTDPYGYADMYPPPILNETNDIGFRIAYVPEPSCIATLSMSVISLIVMGLFNLLARNLSNRKRHLPGFHP